MDSVHQSLKYDHPHFSQLVVPGCIGAPQDRQDVVSEAVGTGYDSARLQIHGTGARLASGRNRIRILPVGKEE